MRPRAIATASLVLIANTAAAQEVEAPAVRIIGTTPLPGLGVPIDQVPANVQTQTADEIRAHQPLDISGQLERAFASVVTLPSQNNPYQSDLIYRGFMASPLAGSPQGLSVFLDGVRINEAFGDTVNWDLVPTNAIDSIQLLPGSNPVFGLNTLGGALAMQTKRGDTSPGASAQASGGSWGRANVQGEYGAHNDTGHVFVAANYGREDGWREHSTSRVGQLFVRAGANRGDSDGDVSLLLADTSLNGIQALPLSMLGDRRQAYTWPDLTENRVAMLSARGNRSFGEDLLLSGGLYLRDLRSENRSSNVNNDFDPTQDIGTDNAPGSMDRGLTESLGWGASLQLVRSTPVFGHDNQLTLGTSIDGARTDYTQWSQPGIFTPDRGVDTIGGEEVQVGAGEHHDYLGLYFSDLFAFDEHWHMTLSGRWNWAKVHIGDETGMDPELTGDHSFHRFNPVIGFNFNPSAGFGTYASYGEGMRVATPMELTCADPAIPCKLPNDFLADPPLKPVVSRTGELGLRGRIADSVRYNAAVYRTDLRDDIQFISSGSTVNAGYFQNVGKTRRVGVELGGEYHVGAYAFSATYSYVRATFESDFLVHSTANSSADANGDIAVTAGDHIPGVPEHSLRLSADYTGERLSLGVNVIAVSSQYARGDENNQDVNGKLPAYCVVNVDGQYRITNEWVFFGEIRNLFDKRYDGSAVLGENFFRGPGGSFDPAGVAPEQFRSPGAPFGIWVGVRYVWNQRKS
jgi:outer membrane receptor protein involved in Fe transport